ncbi:imelysin family protein [Roseivivax marinus]|uniref:imelysin family protein n=1 Tax=Roseivivax marinus TaxID=1379903 RepID=UPI001F03B349|nr:imelysin family protein [Roseivivax marinus]UMA64557.1 imelysin family protein [Roseivivax marinus]
MRALLASTLILAATSAAHAGVEEAVTDHALPATEEFAEATASLADTAEEDCPAEALRPAWNEAFDAWLGLSHLRFGPLEEDSRALTIAFWPDTRGMIPRALGGLMGSEDPVIDSVDGFAEVSIAARGLFGMEQVLYAEDMAGYDTDSYACGLARAQARDLAQLGEAIAADWADFAETVRTAGQDGNETFLSESETKQAFYTALTTGLEYVADQRLGRPLGSFDDPRPDRAEARLSRRSVRNVTLSLEALRELTHALAPGETPRTDEAFAAALDTASQIEDGDLSGVADPMRRVRIESLAQEVRGIRNAAADEVGQPLGVSAGFNATDGD